MSEALRTKIGGRLSLVSPDGACKVLVDDGSGKPAADQGAAAKAADDEKARKAVYQSGWNDCQKKLSAEIADLKKKLEIAQKQLPEALNGYFAQLEAQMREEIVELAFKAAGAIVSAELERDGRMGETLREALKPLMTLQGVKIHVSPAMAAAGAGALNAPAGISILGDPQLGPGELVVESPQGFIDGTVNGRLQALKESFLKQLPEAGG